MKIIMRHLVCALVFITGFFFSGHAEIYQLNEQKLDVHFANSQDITENILYSQQFKDAIVAFPFDGDYVQEDKGEDELVAGIVAVAGLLVFAPAVTLFPTHRFIIGVGGQGGKIWATYCFTLGGCGVITLVDGILLIIDGANGGTKYLESSKFIMW